MPDNNDIFFVNDDGLNETILTDAFSNIVNLLLVVFLCVAVVWD